MTSFIVAVVALVVGAGLAYGFRGAIHGEFIRAGREAKGEYAYIHDVLHNAFFHEEVDLRVKVQQVISYLQSKL